MIGITKEVLEIELSAVGAGFTIGQTITSSSELHWSFRMSVKFWSSRWNFLLVESIGPAVSPAALFAQCQPTLSLYKLKSWKRENHTVLLGL